MCVCPSKKETRFSFISTTSFLIAADFSLRRRWALSGVCRFFFVFFYYFPVHLPRNSLIRRRLIDPFVFFLVRCEFGRAVKDFFDGIKDLANDGLIWSEIYRCLTAVSMQFNCYSFDWCAELWLHSVRGQRFSSLVEKENTRKRNKTIRID